MSYANKLSPLQIRVLRMSREYGGNAVVVVITAVSLILSVGVTALSVTLRPVDAEFVRFALAIAALIPLVVAPLASLTIVRLLNSVANACDELQALASTDALTGIANRRRYFELAAGLLETRPSQTRTLVGMVDLDGFKEINDTFGHATGDLSLIEVAQCLLKTLGPYGVVGRVGGDEFAFCVNVPARELSDLRSQVLAKCRGIPITAELDVVASLGLCEIDGRETIDEAMSLADRALYQVKAERQDIRDSAPEVSRMRRRLGNAQ